MTDSKQKSLKTGEGTGVWTKYERALLAERPFVMRMKESVDYDFLPALKDELTFCPAWSRIPLASVAYGPVGARSRYF